MAWRIDEQVVRGEIDNRSRGRVTGKIWFVGRAEPVELRLEGNAWRDLAGRRLEFSNPHPQPGDPGGLASVQDGVVGDITASRKAKVPDIPPDQIGAYYRAKKPFPWHWGNTLYLEWFSGRNGRVVIETADFELKIVGDAAWEMTEAEETQQRQANGAALTGFMDRLVAAAGQDREIVDATPPEWEETPQTEEEAEKMQAESDRLTDRIQARLDREGSDADLEKIIGEELERRARERGEPPPAPGQEAERAEWVEAMHEAQESLADGEAEEAEEPVHPLAARAFECAAQLAREADAGGWVPEGAPREHPVAELLGAVMGAGAKLAGALDGADWPPSVHECAGVIVSLKRARGLLDDALLALESCQEERLIGPAKLGPIVTAIADLAQGTDALLAELRAKLARGTD